MNLLKKAILYTAIPIMMGSCSLTLVTSNSKQYDRQYESELLEKVRDRRDLSNLTDLEMMTYWDIKFRNSIYSSHLGRDSDGDGIINADDIWKYRYGPFVDSNGNGIVDMFDWQIAGHGNSYIDNYPFKINERWIGLDLNPFWHNEYFFRHNNYFNNHGIYRHHNPIYISPNVIRDNNLRSIRSSTRRNSTSVRDNTRRNSGILPNNTRGINGVITNQPRTRYTPSTNTRTNRSSTIRNNTRSTRNNTRATQSSQTRRSTTINRSSTRSTRNNTRATQNSQRSSSKVKGTITKRKQ